MFIRGSTVALFAWLALAACQLPAQEPKPRLAILTETSSLAPLEDLFAAELSKTNMVELLERAELQKIYREQSAAFVNRNELRTGKLLGADGLLVLKLVPSGQGTNLDLVTRLLAVKPGVVLRAETFAWPLQQLTEWSTPFASRIIALIPKLAISTNDAVPLSIVNFRSAFQSPQAQATEAELKVLAIQRLSQEPRLFVLERQRLDRVAAEKELKSDEAAFWAGAYLLEGVLDQNGYDPNTITVNARLTPPHGAAPLTFEISGSRSNIAQVVFHIATNVTGLLKVNSTLPEWNVADEASQFLTEAQWALRWELYSEAQMASEAAWALGKRDLLSAGVRIKAYVNSIPNVVAPNIRFYSTKGKRFNYTHINDSPDPKYCDAAIAGLTYYEQVCRNSPEAEPKALTPASAPNGWWRNSDWYQLGIDGVAAASRVLQHYYFAHSSRAAVGEKLADLRERTRATAALIGEAKTVRDSYFVGERIATHDELSHTLEEKPSVFRVKLNFGCFWQEQPEDALMVYRELMESPAFCYLHKDFWERDGLKPRLAAWNEKDASRIPQLWENFVSELAQSTNALLQMEAKGLKRAAARTTAEKRSIEAEWLALVRAHREELVGNNVDLFYLSWGFPTTSETEAMERAYWDKTVPARKTLSVFQQQKEYLASFTPYDFRTFTRVFTSKDYTRAQAAELKPLLEAYTSNRVFQAAAGREKSRAQADMHFVTASLGKPIEDALHPPAPPSNQIASVETKFEPRNPSAAPIRSTATNLQSQADVVASNIVSVTQFFPVPLDALKLTNQPRGLRGPQMLSQRWSGGKLLCNVGYQQAVYTFDSKTNWRSTDNVSRSALAIFAPQNGTWTVIPRNESAGTDSTLSLLQWRDDSTVLAGGVIYCCNNGRLEKLDERERSWRAVPIPQGNAQQLFEFDGRLYATGPDIIAEISENGSTKILASTRRRPAASALDTLDTFGAPRLFAALNHTLCAALGGKLYRWTGDDWQAVPTVPFTRAPDVFDEGIIFRQISHSSPAPALLWLWNKAQSQPELCLRDLPASRRGVINSPSPPSQEENAGKPLWHSTTDSLASAPAALHQGKLYFLVDHADVARGSTNLIVLAKNGYHAKLVCLSRESPDPITVPLKFDTKKALPPLKTLGLRAAPWAAADDTAMNSEIHFSGSTLFLAQRNVLGVWAIPVQQIEAAIAPAKAP